MISTKAAGDQHELVKKFDDGCVPVIVNKGYEVDARYLDPAVGEWAGNPYIEALPPPLSDEQAGLRLAHIPKYDEQDRYAPDHHRRLAMREGAKLFIQLDVALDLQQRFQSMIRLGYSDRNPVGRGYRDGIERRIETFDQYADQYDPGHDSSATTAYGFNTVGMSGVGKSRAVLRILSLYPQVINHTCYRGCAFTNRQLVWLKLDCPFDGNTKGLCIQFFNAVDSILGTDYRRNYAGKRRIQDELLSDMALVAANHGVGVLVVDEIQRLNSARSGGAQKMLDFFTHLDNTIGVPVVKIGTYKALPLLSGEFSQMRRGTGQGDLIWDRMENDRQWHYFVEKLWRYQYTHKTCTCDDQCNDGLTLADVLYEESLGIVDIALKLFVFAQERAIATGKEVITPGIIRKVAADKLKMLTPVLRAIRLGDKQALSRYEDAYPALKDHLSQNTGVRVNGNLASVPEAAMFVGNPPAESGGDPPSPNPEPIPPKREIKLNKPAPTRKNRLNDAVTATGTADGKTAYDLLQRAEHVGAGDEFLDD